VGALMVTRQETIASPRVNVGYQMAYARWATARFGFHGFRRPTFFGAWAEMQGQLSNPRPWLLP
jgi:hypothetical protein